MSEPPRIGDIWVYKTYSGEEVYFLVVSIQPYGGSYGDQAAIMPICDTTEHGMWAQNGLTHDSCQIMSETHIWRRAA